VCVVGRTPSHCSTTQYDMLPQYLVCKYELNCEYRNITLARKKVPEDDVTRSKHVGVFYSVLKVFYAKLYVHSLADKFK